MKKVAVLGSGVVGETLANGFLKLGHEVRRGTREPEKLRAWKERGGERASVGTFREAARFGEIVVLAVKGSAAESVVDQAGPEELAGKPVLDATNPIADAPPEHGVLTFFSSLDEALMERLQKRAPKAHFVKAFSCVGSALMVDPDFGGIKPTMFICGDEASAKAQTRAILEQFGWEVEDMGGVQAARAIEPLCILWCIPGFRENRWNHAFKLLKNPG
jgi:predicted dinucleotide-binding enzyme